jgi:hypothetical protein
MLDFSGNSKCESNNLKLGNQLSFKHDIRAGTAVRVGRRRSYINRLKVSAGEPRS